MSNNPVQLQGVTHRYGSMPSVLGVDLEVAGGRTMALLGPSGCGKTTLLRLIAGLERLESGSITIGDRTVAGPGVLVPPERRRIGMVFQDGGLFPHMTVGANVAYGLGSRADRDDRVRRALAMVGLETYADRMPSTLSGGQAQRVAIARSIAPEPDVLLLDEPFASLDTDLRTRLRADVMRLLDELQITAIFVTHDREEAFVVGSEVAVMRDGRIVQVGTPAEIYATPASVWVGKFVGDVNVLDAEAAGEVARTAIGDVRLIEPVSGQRRVLVRPEDVAVSAGGDGIVRAVEFYGHDTSYELDVGGLSVLARAMSAPLHRVGDRVSVSHTGGPARSYSAAD